MTEIKNENRLTLVLDESQPLVERHVCRHGSNPSTTLYAPSSAASSAPASFPPASARSGRPPPLPPTCCATGPITLPACTRLVRSLFTPTMSDTFPFEVEPSTTTPEPILSRN